MIGRGPSWGVSGRAMEVAREGPSDSERGGDRDRASPDSASNGHGPWAPLRQSWKPETSSPIVLGAAERCALSKGLWGRRAVPVCAVLAIDRSLRRNQRGGSQFIHRATHFDVRKRGHAVCTVPRSVHMCMHMYATW